MCERRSTPIVLCGSWDPVHYEQGLGNVLPPPYPLLQPTPIRHTPSYLTQVASTSLESGPSSDAEEVYSLRLIFHSPTMVCILSDGSSTPNSTHSRSISPGRTQPSMTSSSCFPDSSCVFSDSSLLRKSLRDVGNPPYVRLLLRWQFPIWEGFESYCFAHQDSWILFFRVKTNKKGDLREAYFI